MKLRVCRMCGSQYQPSGNSQMYCTQCRCERIKEQKRAWESRKYPGRKPKQKCTETCIVCGGKFACHYDGQPYCNKHYLRMYTHGTSEIKLRDRTNTYDVQGDVTTITTSNGKTFTIDTADLEKVRRYSWCFSRTGYLVANVDKKVVKLHRYLLDAEPGQIIDHINRDPTDNRRANLRFCTAKENSRNVSLAKNNTTGFTGVRFTKSGKYSARITVNRKGITIGTFATLDEAVNTRNSAEKQYFGAFAPR